MTDQTTEVMDPHDPFSWAEGSVEPTELNEMIMTRGFRWTNRITGALAALALTMAGAAGGAWYQRSQGAAANASALAAQFASMRSQTGSLPQGLGTSPGAAAGSTTSGGATSAAADVSGTVVLVDTKNNKLYVRLADGTSKVIVLTKDTSIVTMSPSELAQIKAGADVTVSTTTGGGVTTATTVAMEK